MRPQDHSHTEPQLQQNVTEIHSLQEVSAPAFWSRVYPQPRPTPIAPTHVLEHMTLPDHPPQHTLDERQRFEQAYADSVTHRKPHSGNEFGVSSSSPSINRLHDLDRQLDNEMRTIREGSRYPGTDAERARLIQARNDQQGSTKQPLYVINLPVKQQNLFLRKYFGLLCLALFLTILTSYVLVGQHQVNKWIDNYPWLLIIVAAVAITVLVVYMTPWFRRGSFVIQLVTYICVCAVCTVLVTIMGTYVESGMLFRIVALCAMVIGFLFIFTLQDSAPFRELPAYLFVTALALVALVLLIWLPNRDYYGAFPNHNWLYPPGNAVDVFITTVLTWYVSCCFIRSVLVTMKISEPKDYMDAVIAAYFDIIKLFPAWLTSVIWGRMSSVDLASSSGGGGGGVNGVR